MAVSVAGAFLEASTPVVLNCAMPRPPLSLSIRFAAAPIGRPKITLKADQRIANPCVLDSSLSIHRITVLPDLNCLCNITNIATITQMTTATTHFREQSPSEPEVL